jgi:tetratricopeptide (TPR) repeat protein
MSRPQIILTAIALVLVVGMFFLPKAIITKDANNSLEKPATAARDKGAEEHSADDGHGHTEEELAGKGGMPNQADMHKADPAELKMLADLRQQYESANAEAKVGIAEKLGAQYTAIGKFDSAGYYYEKVAAARPTEKVYQKAADQYFEAFSYAATEDRAKQFGTKAQSLYDKVLKNNPANLDAKTNLAMTYIASDNPMKGIGLLREVIAADPKNEKALYNLGVLSIQSNQYDKAVERFNNLIAVNPKHVNGTFYLGVALAETGKKEEAIAAFTKVKELDKTPSVQASADNELKKLQQQN